MGDIRLRRWQLWSAGASEASEARPRFGSLRRGVPIPVVFGRRFALSAQPLFLSLSSSKRRRGPGRGGVFYQFPLSPALSPLVPREEREAERRRRFACRTQLVGDRRSSRSVWLWSCAGRTGLVVLS